MNTNATAQMVTSGGAGCLKEKTKMKITDQIAAEAAAKIHSALLHNVTDEQVEFIQAIIKAAIEEATEQQAILHGQLREKVLKLIEQHESICPLSRAAHASEQEPEDSMKTPEGEPPRDKTADQIAIAIGKANALRQTAGQCLRYALRTWFTEEQRIDEIVRLILPWTGKDTSRVPPDLGAESASEQEYDDLLPVCLHQAKDGIYHLLDRHNDEIATFDRTIEIEDMERIVKAVNRASHAPTHCPYCNASFLPPQKHETD